jgi:hypothetical protein
MHTPDDYGPTIPKDQQNWTNSYQPVQVDCKDLVDYHNEMLMNVGAQVASQVTPVMLPMPEMVSNGLLGQNSKSANMVGNLPEATNIANILTGYQGQFKQFLDDVNKGIQCIANAAGVIAEIYRNGDAENSANLNDVLFAFADPGANKPKGFPAGANTKTFAEQQQDSGAANQPDALGDESSATQVINPVNGVTIYFFADGSSKQITTTTIDGKTTTSTSIYANGAVVSTQTQQTYKDATGSTVRTISQSPGDNPKAVGTSTTTMTTDKSGTTTIQTSTVGSDGKTKTSDPTTVSSGSSSSAKDPGQGPIQQAEQQYDSQGSDDYLKDHGAGY